MKIIKALVVIGSVIASFAPRAEVNLNFHSDISPLLVGGEEVGYSFFAKPSYAIPDGTNQIVLRVSKLVERLGEKEKFNSKTFVLTFDGENEDIFIKPDVKITRIEHAEEFDRSPQFSLKNPAGKVIKYEIAELPNLGGIKRDYAKELTKFNVKYYPELAAASLTSQASISTKSVKQQIIENNVLQVDNVAGSEPNMFQYWLTQASEEDLVLFSDIVIASRKETSVIIPEGESQPIQMLGYWFNKASVEQRQQILAYLITR